MDNRRRRGVQISNVITNNIVSESAVSLGKKEEFTMLAEETTKVVDFSADLDADKDYGVFLYEVIGVSPAITLKSVAIGFANGATFSGESVNLSNPLLTINPSAVTFTFENLVELTKYRAVVVQID